MTRVTKLKATALVLLLSASVVAGAGALTVGADTADQDGNNDVRENATSLQMNSTTTETIDGPNDTDWYAVDVTEAKRLLAGIDIDNSNTSNNQSEPQEKKDVTIAVYGPEGEQLEEASTELDTKNGAGVNHGVTSADTYYIKVASGYSEDAEDPVQDSNGSKEYRLDVESVALDTNEPNDDEENATSLSANETVSNNILRLEDDKYALELKAGDTVTVTYNVKDRLNHDGAAMPTKTSVVGPGGEEVAASEETGSATYTFTAPETGTYMITVTSKTDEMAASGVRGNDLTRYGLTVTVDESDNSGC